MIKIITKIESDNIKIPGYQEFLGKDVEITIKEIDKEEKDLKWTFGKKVDLNGALDDVNIRDFAYE